MTETQEVKISTLGMNCPKPLIETRKALNKLISGGILTVEGDHKTSLAEIPKAVQDTGDEVLDVQDQGSKWIIKIKKG